MARGSIAKEVIVKKLKDAFGADFIGEVDKKIYIWASAKRTFRYLDELYGQVEIFFQINI